MSMNLLHCFPEGSSEHTCVVEVCDLKDNGPEVRPLLALILTPPPQEVTSSFYASVFPWFPLSGTVVRSNQVNTCKAQSGL